jgi:AAA domain-containing protein
MAEFRQYLCWAPTIAGATINTEAVSPAPAVFFATHAPLRIRRRHPEGRADVRSVEVTEEEVRRDFLERVAPNGVLLMPVVGESGAGKSHLVRWIHEKTPPTPSRAIIYLPKTSTSLRAVVRAFLDQPGVESPELAQLRADVDRMSSELDQSSLERRLINELSEAVAVADPKPGAARILAGPDRLATLLLDPHIRDHLLREGNLIPRLAASLLSDKDERDIERPTSFTVDDLPLDIADVKKASDKAIRLLMQITSKPELQTAAVEILTEQLPTAVTAAWNIGGGRLQDAMLEIRRQYARQGKEIILLIEDFAVIQGVQRDLLDALIEVGEREGRTVLAPVRTLMAVTSGYLARVAETVLTRAKAATPYVYDLDAAFDTSERGRAEVGAFVGRYLNAARVGHQALKEAGVEAGAAVPNKCEDCPFKETCHATFGVSTDGHGLYPFNWPALRRAIRARPAHDNPDSFNPRAVIGEVIRPVLIEHAESLHDATFPDERFRENFPTPPSETFLLGLVKQEIEERDPAGALRRETFLEFWGDAPANLTDLDPALHTAFGINRLGIDERPPPRRTESATRTPSATTRRSDTRPAADEAADDGLTPGVRKMLTDIENWQGRGAQLPQQTARTIREIIRQAVISRSLWNEPIMAEPLTTDRNAAWPARPTVVSIEGAEGEGGGSAGATAPIRFKRRPASAALFRQLVLANAGVVAGNAGALRRLHRLAEQQQTRMQQAVARTRGFSDDELVLSMRASLLGAVLAGSARPDMTEQALLDVVFDDGASWLRPPSEGRLPAWLALWDAHRATRPELVTKLRESVGYRRGTSGAVRLIDATRAVPLLRQAAGEWTWNKPEKLPAWAEKAVAGFTKFADTMQSQVTSLRGQLAQMRVALPAGTGGKETIAAIEQALDAALGEGLGPDDLIGFRAILAEAKQCDWRGIDQLDRDLTKLHSAPTPEETYRATVVAAARNDGRDLVIILRFLISSDAWLDHQLKAAKQRDGGAGAAAASRVQDLLDRWRALDGGPQ